MTFKKSWCSGPSWAIQLTKRKRQTASQHQQAAVLNSLHVQIMELVAKLTGARKQAKLSQKELAANIGISQSSLARIEAGRTNPTLKSLLQITGALGLSLNPQRFQP